MHQPCMISQLVPIKPVGQIQIYVAGFWLLGKQFPPLIQGEFTHGSVERQKNGTSSTNKQMFSVCHRFQTVLFTTQILQQLQGASCLRDWGKWNVKNWWLTSNSKLLV